MELKQHEIDILNDLTENPPFDQAFLSALWRGKTRDIQPIVMPQNLEPRAVEGNLVRLATTPNLMTIPLYERSIACRRFEIAAAVCRAMRTLRRGEGDWTEEVESLPGLSVRNLSYVDRSNFGVRISSEYFGGQEDGLPYRCTTDLGEIRPDDAVLGLRFTYAPTGPVTEDTTFDFSFGRWYHLKDGLTFNEGFHRVKPRG